MRRQRRSRARRRKPAWLRLLLALLAVAAVVVGSRLPRTARHAEDWTRFDRAPATVVGVADGDTLTVRLDDGTEQVVRLLGIDAPELDASFGDRAKNYLLARAGPGKQVTLTLDDVGSRDRYGRLLAYVWLPPDQDDLPVNVAIVRDGLAFAHRRFPSGLASQIESAESVAMSSRRGMWKSITEEQMPEWRRTWMRERGLSWPP